MDLNVIQLIAVFALPVVFAITLHEAAHGYVARHFGDFTAHLAGRISLNPLRHVDPVGTVLVPGALLVFNHLAGSSIPPFGWAKPVPVAFGNLRNPKRDMLWVAAAGPGANLLMALGWALVLRISQIMPENAFSTPLALIGVAGIQVNVVLMIVNLLPVPPLDGGRIAVSLLPLRMAIAYARVEPYGMFILVFLLVSHVLDRPLGMAVKSVVELIVSATFP